MSKGQAHPATQYDQALARLVAVGRAMADAESKWKSTPLTTELRAVAELSEQLHQRLASTDVWQEIEESLGEATDSTLNALILRLIEVRDAAHSAAKRLPDPRARPAAPWVVSAWLHLRYRHALPLPKTSVDGADVGALVELLCACGFKPTRDNASTMLKKALKAFEPTVVPDGFDGIA